MPNPPLHGSRGIIRVTPDGPRLLFSDDISAGLAMAIHSTTWCSTRAPIAPKTRRTIHVNEEDPAVQFTDVSARIVSDQLAELV